MPTLPVVGTLVPATASTTICASLQRDVATAHCSKMQATTSLEEWVDNLSAVICTELRLHLQRLAMPGVLGLAVLRESP